MDNNNNLFDDDEEEIKKINTFISGMISNITKGMNDASKDGTPNYSFSIRIDKDGTPVLEEQRTPTSESIHMKKTNTKDAEHAPAPLYDVVEDSNYVTIVMECKGFKKNDISICMQNNNVLINFSTDKKMDSIIKLPCTVKKTGSKAELKNGVLHVKLKKARAVKTFKISIK